MMKTWHTNATIFKVQNVIGAKAHMTITIVEASNDRSSNGAPCRNARGLLGKLQVGGAHGLPRHDGAAQSDGRPQRPGGCFTYSMLMRHTSNYSFRFCINPT